MNIMMLTMNHSFPALSEIEKTLQIPESFYSRLLSKYDNYKSLMENLNGFAYTALLVPGQNPVYTFISHSSDKLLGIPADDLIHQTPVYPDLILPEDLTLYRYTLESAAESGSTYEMNYRIQSRSGNILYVTDKGKVLTDEKENPLMIQGLVTDSTRVWKAEHQLRKKEQNLNIIISNISEYIYSISYKSGNPEFKYHSPRSTDITGYTPEEYTEDPELWYKMIHPDDRASVVQTLTELRKKGGSGSIEHRIIHKNGSIRWVQNTVKVTLDAAGNIKRTDGFILDITERIQSQLNRTRIFSAMSHDIRTPMHGMLGLTELLLQDSELSELQKKYIQMIHLSGQNLMNILNDILDFSKSESGKVRLHSEICSLHSLISTVVPPFRIQAESKGLAFDCEIASDVPDQITGDPVRLSRILMNLLSNAVKFTKHGKVRLDVRTLPHLSETPPEIVRIIFTISDTGPGIPPEKKDLVFEPYVQFSGKHGGTGLGTTISKQFTELMGGTISVNSPSVLYDPKNSSAGPGTDFNVVIPFHISH